MQIILYAQNLVTYCHFRTACLSHALIWSTYYIVFVILEIMINCITMSNIMYTDHDIGLSNVVSCMNWHIHSPHSILLVSNTVINYKNMR